KQEVGTATRIIDNLMELSRGKEPKKQAVDLLQAVREIYARVPVADGIDLTCSVEPEPFEVYVDPGQFHRVLDNLVTNAVQAMERRGEITVEAVRDGQFDEITVRDEGPGITEQEREQVFEPLYSTRTTGTGLGLTIGRQIIECHGGTLELAEAEGPGAVFRIRLPRREVTDI
ncbi:MAG: ATP-binding protein, partial [Bacteroidetes bacterium]|nr:ATP-binding protein [Bacteroidota bacterium]